MRTLRLVEAEARPARPEEQRVLARWGGWGATGLAQVFDETREEFAADRDELRGLLTTDQYAAARRTTVNAYYTDPALVREIWQAVERLGFSGGLALEPGCGAGAFIGLAPPGTAMTGVELDPTTAAIAALLYPDADIRAESFADTRCPAGRFDVAVGNVPFAQGVVLHDPRWNSAGHTMHNHFIVKSLGLTRPGGLAALLTSSYTMDSLNPAARREMNSMADLIAAVRLPTGAHRRAAGTDVVTDLLIFRRRGTGTEPSDRSWETTHLAEMPGPSGALESVRLNSYWSDHPQFVLGRPRLDIGMYGRATLEIQADPTTAAAALRHALEQVVADAGRRGLLMTPRIDEAPEMAAVVPSGGRLDGDIAVAATPGTFTTVEDGAVVPFAVPKTQAPELTALVSLKQEAKALVEAEAHSLDDTDELDTARQRLRDSWAAYADRYGPINRYTTAPAGRIDPDTGEPVTARRRPPVMRLLRGDPAYPLLAALELFDGSTQTAQPSGLLRGRLIVPRKPVLGVETALDGLAVVLDTLGRLDLDEIARLQGSTRAHVVEELGDAIFETPPAAPDLDRPVVGGLDTTFGGAEPADDPLPAGGWLTRAEYLSGDIRSKLAEARSAALEDPARWSRNVEALESVLPPDIEAGDISVRLGAVWIPASDHQAFLRDILESGHPVVLSAEPGVWEVTGADFGVAAEQEWGTPALPAGRLLQTIASQKTIQVYRTIEDAEGRERRVLDLDATQAAVEKGEQMQERFSAWLWEDPARAARLIAEYNRRFNSLVLRDYTEDGRHLTLPGLVRTFAPGDHQRAAVARMIAEKSVLLAHPVGAGKTAEMVIGAMELKRLGLINKPAVCVPNHMLEQFSREWLQLYPQARILAASSDDLAGEQRRRFVARAATNDWDAIILTRTALQRLELEPEHEDAFIRRQLDSRRAALAAAKDQPGGAQSRSVKRQEAAIAREEERLKSRLGQRRDPGITFEETGIDYLIVDEMHQYKNLATVTAIDSASIAGSQRAMDLLSKVEHLRSQHGDRILCGATATPIANSMTEMHVMMRYFDPELLTRAGIEPFDAFAATFGQTVTGFELNTVGRQVLKSRMARFTNLPELQTMFRTFTDVATADDLHLPRPALAVRDDGERAARVIPVPRSPELARYMERLGQRADDVKHRAVTPDQDNMLLISSHGRMAALDMRLVDPAALPDQTKVDAAADELHRVWRSNRGHTYLDRDGNPSPVSGALQIVFCDLSTPNPNRWNVYHALRAALVDRGLPEQSIRFMQDAKTDADKAALFDACRDGQVSVLIGSTETMGVGTNIQDRAIHLLHLDAPWRPADIEQRNGRILRQGNQNPEILITQVVTQESFDSVMWQTLERKARFIEQIMTGGNQVRVADDIAGDQSLSFAEVKAIASGNPLILEATQAELDVQRLTRLQRAHDLSQRSLTIRKTQAERAVDRDTREIARLTPLAQRITPTAGDQFALRLDGATHASRPGAADALGARLSNRYQRLALARQTDPITIGGLGVSYEWRQGDRWSERPDQHVWRLTEVPEVFSVQTTRSDQSPSAQGAIQLLEHLPGKLPAHIARLTVERQEALRTIERADKLIGAPFRHSDDLERARVRHQTIRAELAAQCGQDPAPEPDGPAADQEAQEAAATLSPAAPADPMAFAVSNLGRPGATRTVPDARAPEGPAAGPALGR